MFIPEQYKEEKSLMIQVAFRNLLRHLNQKTELNQMLLAHSMESILEKELPHSPRNGPSPIKATLASCNSTPSRSLLKCNGALTLASPSPRRTNEHNSRDIKKVENSTQSFLSDPLQTPTKRSRSDFNQ